MNKKIPRTKVAELSPKFLTQGAGYVGGRSGPSQCCQNFKPKSAQEDPTSQHNYPTKGNGLAAGQQTGLH